MPRLIKALGRSRRRAPLGGVALMALLALMAGQGCCSNDLLGPPGAITTRQEVRDDAGRLRRVRVWVDGDLVREERYREDGSLSGIVLQEEAASD